MRSKAFSSVAFFLYFNILLSEILIIPANCASPDSGPSPSPTPMSVTPPPAAPSNTNICSINPLRLAVCAPLLIFPIGIGKLSRLRCCGILQGLTDRQAPVCLCHALEAKMLGNNVNIPIVMALVLNTCGIQPPVNFQCA
ncbi:14 kDa proline-rich protein DC2.15-like [Quillaja saponaria]|uniref:14 kDa proline-rich protein DC2.15-like n=1 Tax=Quillaja saponaria TaxID=32244 RepID=A0AAD7L4W0_QUISA|nr:14 kDa proline-rich protein DC2.15-like [Quillaja saponaria]